jgi:VIT1/CCC1 family predicted Fe2+/Mn2+ transporter
VSDDRSWFSFVSRLLAIGRERFLAFVDPEMETIVLEIHTHIDQFSADYERTPAENHRGNVPVALRSRIASMISIKSTHSKGNFQLTLTHLADPDEVLLDADIDEHGDLLGHFLDLFKHKITGGTHPNDVHELLVLQEGQTAGFDLGYRLVPQLS